MAFYEDVVRNVFEAKVLRKIIAIMSSTAFCLLI